MRKTFLALLGGIILTSGSTLAGEKIHWEYSGDSGVPPVNTIVSHY